MPRKKPIAVVAPEPEVLDEVSIGPVKSKVQRSTLCCLAGVLALVGLIIFYNIAYSQDGFARAREVSTTFNERMTMILSLGGSLDRIERMVADKDKETRALILTGQINTAQRAYCAAIKAGDSPAISLAGDQVTQYLITYQSLTGEDFPIKLCP